MSDKKLSLDDTVAGWNAADGGSEDSSGNSFEPVFTPNHASGGLFGALGYNGGDFEEFEEQSGDVQDDEVVDESLAGVPEEIFDEDLDFEPDVPVQEPIPAKEPVVPPVDLKEVFKKQEQEVDKVVEVPKEIPKEAVTEPVASVPDVSVDDTIGHVPENIVKPIRVIDVVRKGRNGANKPSNKKSGTQQWSGKKKSSKGDSGLSETIRMCHVKGIPRMLIDMIMMDFKSETPKSQADALIAWIVCHCEEDKILRIAPYLTDYQVGLIEGWENTPNAAIQQKLDSVVKRLQTMAVDMDTLKLLVGYEIFDRLGYRQESTMVPRNVNLMEHGVLDVIVRAEEQTPQMRNDRGLQKGRPIR